MPARILVFAGSIRSGAYSGRTADAAIKELALQGAETTRISLADYPLPLMDEDLEREKGVPENAMRLARVFAGQDGLVICTPEYNGSLPPLLKNTLDWLSRVKRDGGRPLKPYEGKVAGLCSSSDGNFGGNYAIQHLRQVLIKCRVEMITPQVLVPNAHDAFDDEGQFEQERIRHQMTALATTLIERVALLSRRIEP
ncbi:MAG: NADPH-dependent FMN reductase [Rhizobiaceae bacterium]